MATLIVLPWFRLGSSALVKSGDFNADASHQDIVKEDEDRQRMACEKHHALHEAAISA